VSFKVVELKDELTKRGLVLSGKKTDLVDRLEAYILEHEIEDLDEVEVIQPSRSRRGIEPGSSRS